MWCAWIFVSCIALKVFVQITFDHVSAVCDIGKELERECDFATALKYYYAGRAYYAKRAVEMSTSLSSSTTCKPIFHALHDALTKVAENDANWKIRNSGGLLQSHFGVITISPETCAEHVKRLVGQHLQLKDRTSSVQEVFLGVWTFPLVFQVTTFVATGTLLGIWVIWSRHSWKSWRTTAFNCRIATHFATKTIWWRWSIVFLVG